MTYELRVGVVEGAVVFEVWRGGEAVARVEGGERVQLVAATGRRFAVEATARLVGVELRP